MGVYIKGMEMPKNPVLFCIHPDGKVFADLEGGWGEYNAVPVPPHGRLIDADAMEKLMSDTVQGDIRGYPYSDTLWDMAFRWIDNQPTVIPADKDGGEDG